MESSLIGILGQILRMKDARIKRDKPFGDYGLDSLMAVELKNRCESALGIPLPATLAWNYPTLAVLAEHLASQLGLPLDEDSGLSEPLNGLALGGAAQQVLEIKFNKVIGIAVFKEFGAVEATLCHRTHKFPGAQIAGAK